MAKFKINGDVPAANVNRTVEAEHFEHEDGFINFTRRATDGGGGDEVVYSVSAQHVHTVERVED